MTDSPKSEPERLRLGLNGLVVTGSRVAAMRERRRGVETERELRMSRGPKTSGDVRLRFSRGG